MSDPIFDDTDLALTEAQGITAEAAVTADAITEAAITAEADESAGAITTDEAPKSAVTTEPPDAHGITTPADLPPSGLQSNGVAHAIARTLPTPPPSNPVLPDGAGDAVTDQPVTDKTLEVITKMSTETPVQNIAAQVGPEANTVMEPDSPKQAAARKKRNDLFRAKLKAKGLSEEDMDELCISRQICNGAQRVMPSHLTVCSPERVAFWASHHDPSRRGLWTAALKQIRRDANVSAATNLEIIKSCSPEDAAVRIEANTDDRLRSFRHYIGALINEDLRREAEENGVDPKTITYLVVR
jgi:hypothetical protein